MLAGLDSRSHGNHSGSFDNASSWSTSGVAPELIWYCQAAKLAAQPGWYGEYSGALVLL
jgi:hypothetical protein